MLTVTESAKAQLNQMIDKQGSGDQTVRVVKTDTGFSVALDEPKPNDMQFDHDGKTVLVMDKNVGTLLKDKTLGVSQQSGSGVLTLE